MFLYKTDILVLIKLFITIIDTNIANTAKILIKIEMYEIEYTVLLHSTSNDLYGACNNLHLDLLLSQATQTSLLIDITSSMRYIILTMCGLIESIRIIDVVRVVAIYKGTTHTSRIPQSTHRNKH